MARQAERVVVIGAGGFGREALDVAEALGHTVIGVLDDNPRDKDLERLEARGIAYLGPAEPGMVVGADSVAVAVGSPAARRRLFERFSGSRFAVLVHPRAVVGSEAEVGAGVIVCAGVSVGTNVALSLGCHLNPNATIGHDTVLHEFVSINPAANISGECTVEADVLVGASAVVLQGLTVGTGATVGAGAVVVRNVPDNTVVMGVPAR